MAEVRKVEVSGLYLNDRHGVVVKHFKRSDRELTMCGKEIESALRYVEICRVCVVCDRWRREFEEQQARELEIFARWQGLAAGQDAASASSTSFSLEQSVGCAFGSIVDVPSDEE